MIDTRLINQVLVWERRIEIENEKQKNLHPHAYAGLPTAPEPCQKAQKSIFARIFRHSLGHNLTIHSAEPAGTPDNPIYCES